MRALPLLVMTVVAALTPVMASAQTRTLPLKVHVESESGAAAGARINVYTLEGAGRNDRAAAI